MARSVLDEDRIHPAVRGKVAANGAAIVAEVQAAIAANAVVVVGMAMNPFPRIALKMWSGWQTFPMVFVKGVLVGGASDVARLVESGELKRLLP